MAKRKRKPGSGKRSGSAFEREICNQLGEWWAGRTDIFWRTATSGGRATVRHRKGVKTKGQHGDIMATDPIGAKLLQVLTLEVKRGYAKTSIQDLVDTDRNTVGCPIFTQWINKAIHSHAASGSFSWALIVRRQTKVSMICLDLRIVERLRSLGVKLDRVKPSFKCIARTKAHKQKSRGEIIYYKPKDVELLAMPLDLFLARVSRKDIEKIARQWKREKQL